MTFDISGLPVILRPEQEQDAAFLAALFHATVSQAFMAMPLDETMRATLVRVQLAAQAAAYHARFPNARFDIIERDAIPIGRIVIDPGGDAGCIVDFALVPERQSHGLGTAILAAVLERFGERQQHVLCQVLASNRRSLRMCHRVGFRQVGDAPPFLQLAWHPCGAGPNT